MEEQAIVPVEQRTVDFYGDELIAVRDEKDTVWVPVRPVCDALGLNWSGQYERMQRDPVLSTALASVRVTRTEAGEREMTCLPLKYVRGWLFGVNANRVKPEIRDKLIQYQRDVIEIIDRHFGRPLTVERMSETMMQAMHENALQQAQIWKTLLEEQRRLRATEELVQEHESQLIDHARALWRHEHALSDLRELQQRQSETLTRLNDVTRLLPTLTETISPAQKAAIKALVDDIVAAAQERGVRLGQGRNDYPAVWDAFKRRFDLAKYDELAGAQYDEALEWLKGWLDRIRAG